MACVRPLSDGIHWFCWAILGPRLALIECSEYSTIFLCGSSSPVFSCDDCGLPIVSCNCSSAIFSCDCCSRTIGRQEVRPVFGSTRTLAGSIPGIAADVGHRVVRRPRILARQELVLERGEAEVIKRTRRYKRKRVA